MEKGFNKEEIIARLVSEYMDFKDIEKESAISLAEAIYEECKMSDVKSVSDPFMRYLLDINMANVNIGKQGVGCRGSGDFLFINSLQSYLRQRKRRIYPLAL